LLAAKRDTPLTGTANGSMSDPAPIQSDAPRSERAYNSIPNPASSQPSPTSAIEKQYSRKELSSKIPLQEQQFCDLINQYDADLKQAVHNQNQIQFTETSNRRKLDLQNLMPHGAFRDWLANAVEVMQASDGLVAVILEPRCNNLSVPILIGSDCGADTTHLKGTIPKASQFYRELAKLNSGNPVLVSGEFPTVEEEAQGPFLPTDAPFSQGSHHCWNERYARRAELFIIELKSIFRMTSPNH